MSGEVLRDRLTRLSINRHPRWYTAVVRLAANAPIGVPQSSIIQFLAGKQFLWTGLSIITLSNAAGDPPAILFSDYLVELERPDTGRKYQAGPENPASIAPVSLLTNNNNTTGEYDLFYGNETLRMIVTPRSTLGVTVDTHFTFAGIEYLMG